MECKGVFLTKWICSAVAIQSKQKSSFQLSFDDHEQISSNFGFRYSAENIGQNVTKKTEIVNSNNKFLSF